MNINNRNKIIFAVGFLIIITSSVFVYFSIVNVKYIKILEGADNQVLSDAVQVFENESLKFKYPEFGGGLLVRDTQKTQAQLLLQHQGVFNDGTVGFELFDESQHSMSDFYQQINYQRALQGELEQTILGMENVEGVRVHIALPENKAFSRQEQKAKAVVNISYLTGSNVPIELIVAIKKLVANSVNQLDEESVSVLDNSGKALASGGNSISASDLVSTKKQLETEVEEKLKKVLTFYFGSDEVTVSAWVDVNMDDVTETKQGTDGTEDPIVTSKTTEFSKRNKKSLEKVTNEDFSYPTYQRQTKYQRGRIEKIAVAVVVPYGYSEVEDFKRMLSAAVGLNFDRGDQLSVVQATKNEGVNLLPPQQSLGNRAEISNGSLTYTDRVDVSKPVIDDLVKNEDVIDETSKQGDGAINPIYSIVVNNINVISVALIFALCLLFLLVLKNRSSRTHLLSKKEEEMILLELKQWAVTSDKC
ncbi:flagellar M-ring protein FliF [Motilimonas cestriensis]|uniref:Flagellar M-ring protein n=1 Tax=Motilimonas cestriensis TaxID=2742685 RepID=A0ABS8WG09_9GAMM|nr:flagellar basal-body MS-ring/collar protein FliF [Motilimonas cestriensis]MCE2597117.1 flagellar M-ring protein FliF [Motilimonas cestriensis]